MTIRFNEDEGMFFYCAGPSPDGWTFKEAFKTYCFRDRVEPTPDYAARMRNAINRGISAGLIEIVSVNRIRLSDDIGARLDSLWESEKNEFEACWKLDEYLMSREWPVVCNDLLPE